MSVQIQSMSFDKFYKLRGGDSGNLYIIWRDKQALYVGISNSGIWGRWFSARNSHICVNYWGDWNGYTSDIGRAIIGNRPASMDWIIEVRDYSWDEALSSREHELIQQLRPLFNTMSAPIKTDQELELRAELLPL